MRKTFTLGRRRQAALLRALMVRARDLPNGLEVEQIAEEIEDLGRSEVRAVESYLKLLFLHLIKRESCPSSPAARHWTGEVQTQIDYLIREYRSSMRQAMRLDLVWRAAMRQADEALDQAGDVLLPGLPKECPIGLDELVDLRFDPTDSATWRAAISPRADDR